ncbi:MAG: S24 family peptidase [Balneolaceae bacterium]
MIIQENINSAPAGKPSPTAQTRETGFPSPAADHRECRLDLHEHLVKNKSATFFCRIRGREEEPLGFYDGDLLIVDRSLAFKHHSYVVVALEDEFRVCRLWNRKRCWSLQTAENKFIALNRGEYSRNMFWGVVSHVIHSCI